MQTYAKIQATDTQQNTHANRLLINLFGNINVALMHGLTILKNWHQRARTRQQLLALSTDQLKDIGHSRVEAMTEGNKHFWQD